MTLQTPRSKQQQDRVRFTLVTKSSGVLDFLTHIGTSTKLKLILAQNSLFLCSIQSSTVLFKECRYPNTQKPSSRTPCQLWELRFQVTISSTQSSFAYPRISSSLISAPAAVLQQEVERPLFWCICLNVCIT